MTEKKVEKVGGVCLIEGCGAGVKSRGLCTHHYAIASGRVKAKTGAWEQFEKLGLSLKPLSGATGIRVDQFNAQLSKALAASK